MLPPLFKMLSQGHHDHVFEGAKLEIDDAISFENLMNITCSPVFLLFVILLWEIGSINIQFLYRVGEGDGCRTRVLPSHLIKLTQGFPENVKQLSFNTFSYFTPPSPPPSDSTNMQPC